MIIFEAYKIEYVLSSPKALQIPAAEARLTVYWRPKKQFVRLFLFVILSWAVWKCNMAPWALSECIDCLQMNIEWLNRWTFGKCLFCKTLEKLEILKVNYICNPEVRKIRFLKNDDHILLVLPLTHLRRFHFVREHIRFWFALNWYEFVSTTELTELFFKNMKSNTQLQYG